MNDQAREPGSSLQQPAAASASIPGATLLPDELLQLARLARLPDSLAAHPGVKDAMRRAYLFGFGAGQLAEIAARADA